MAYAADAQELSFRIPPGDHSPSPLTALQPPHLPSRTSPRLRVAAAGVSVLSVTPRRATIGNRRETGYELFSQPSLTAVPLSCSQPAALGSALSGHFQQSGQFAPPLGSRALARASCVAPEALNLGVVSPHGAMSGEVAADASCTADVAKWLNTTFSQAQIEPRLRLGEQPLLPSLSHDGGVESSAGSRVFGAAEPEPQTISSCSQHEPLISNAEHRACKDEEESSTASGLVPLLPLLQAEPASSGTLHSSSVYGRVPLYSRTSMLASAHEASAVPSPQGAMDGCEMRGHEGLHQLLREHNVALLDVDDIHFDLFSALSQLRTAKSGEGTPHSLSDDCSEQLFFIVCANVFFRYRFIERLGLNVPKLLAFFRVVGRHYLPTNPYHNALHAADVLHSCHIYLLNGDVWRILHDQEIICLLLSAIVHDVGHLGVTNGFLQTVEHPVCKLYNGISALENMHASLAFHLLSQPEHNFFSSDTDIWPPTATSELHRKVVEMVLGTDMRNHAKMVEGVKSMLSDGQIGEDDIEMLMVAILHAADLSNPMKDCETYKKWAHRVCAEFFREGDELCRRGLSVLPMFDRANITRFPETQVGFMSFVVRPFVREIAAVLPPKWLEQLEENIGHMKILCGTSYADTKEMEALAATPWGDAWSATVAPQLTRMLNASPVLGAESRHEDLLESSGDAPKSVVECVVVAAEQPQSDARVVSQLSRAVADCAASLSQALQRAIHRLFAIPADSRLAIEEMHEGYAFDIMRGLQSLRRSVLDLLIAFSDQEDPDSSIFLATALREIDKLVSLGKEGTGEEDEDYTEQDPEWCLYLLRTIWAHDDCDDARVEITAGSSYLNIHQLVRQNTLTLSAVVAQYVATKEFSTAVSDTTTNRGMCVYYSSSSTGSSRTPQPHAGPPLPSCGRASAPPLIGMPQSLEGLTEGDTSSSSSSPTLVGLRGLRNKLQSSGGPLQRFFPPLFQTAWNNPNASIERLSSTSSTAARRINSMLREAQTLDPTSDECHHYSNQSKPYASSSNVSPGSNYSSNRASAIGVESRAGSFRGAGSSSSGGQLSPARLPRHTTGAEGAPGNTHVILPAVFEALASAAPPLSVRSLTTSPARSSENNSPSHRRVPHAAHDRIPSMEDITLPVHSVFGDDEDDLVGCSFTSIPSVTAGQLQRISDTGAAVPTVYLLRTASMRSAASNSVTLTPR
jgi:hypothetical protein